MRRLERPTRFRLPSRFTVLFGDTFLSMVWSLAPLVAGIGFLAWQNFGSGAGLVLLGAVMTFLSLRTTEVIAGADGVLVRWLGRSRFISYDEVPSDESTSEFVERKVKYKRAGSFLFPRTVEKSRGVLFRHRDGPTYLVCDDVVARDLIAVIDGRRAAHRRMDPTELVSIRRGDRTVADWIASARALLGQPDGYRGRATTEDELWTVLENPKSEPDERAAAAIALRAHLGEEARPRIRVAIEACAAPRLRVALEAIDDGDERAANASLERLTGAPTSFSAR